MMENRRTFSRSLPVVLSLLVVGGAAAPVPGQDLPRLTPDGSGRPLLPPQALFDGTAGTPSAGAGKAARIRLFRMQTGFLTDPVGLDGDDDNAALLADPAAAVPDSSSDGRLGLVLGR